LCYCARHLTDGILSFDVLFRSPFGSRSGAKRERFISLVSDLVETGLWDWTAGGFAIHDYLVYNPTAAKVREERRLKAERQARWLARKKQDKDAPRDASRRKRRDAPPTPTPKSVGVEAPPLADTSSSKEENPSAKCVVCDTDEEMLAKYAGQWWCPTHYDEEKAAA
jgi:hypothetical protein